MDFLNLKIHAIEKSGFQLWNQVSPANVHGASPVHAFDLKSHGVTRVQIRPQIIIHHIWKSVLVKSDSNFIVENAVKSWWGFASGQAHTVEYWLVLSFWSPIFVWSKSTGWHCFLPSDVYNYQAYWDPQAKITLNIMMPSYYDTIVARQTECTHHGGLK